MEDEGFRRFLDALDGLDRQSFAGVVFRGHAPAYSALSGDGARRFGGRWNPPGSFPVVYTATELETVVREVARTMARGAVTKPGRRVVSRLRVRFSRVLDLTDEAIRSALGVDTAAILDDDVTISRALGEAANYLGYEAILAPSASGSGKVLAILLINRAASSELVALPSAPEGHER